MAKTVHFLVKHNDEQTIELIKNVCKDEPIEANIIYHGPVSFRGSMFKIFSREKSIYTSFVEQYGIMRSLYNDSHVVRQELLISPHTIVGCIGKDITSLVGREYFSSSISVTRKFVIFADCPKVIRWVGAFEKFFPQRKDLLRALPCMKQIITEL